VGAHDSRSAFQLAALSNIAIVTADFRGAPGTFPAAAA
jgi:hypothetical protein